MMRIPSILSDSLAFISESKALVFSMITTDFFAVKVNQENNQRKKEYNKPGQTNVQHHHGVKGGNKDKDSRNKARQNS